MVREPCSELAGGDMSKDIVKKDKKKKKERKKKEEEAEMKGQKQKFDTSAENLVMEGKQSSEPKKSKRKRNDAGEASAGDQVVKRDDKKRKKKHPVVLEQSSQKQTYETTVENLVIEGDKVEVNQSSKSKKSKHKCDDAGEASAGNQVVTREDKKRKKKHPVVLEESSQKQTLDTTIENLVTEGDKVEVKQSSKSKKSKHKCDGAGEASAGNQVVTKEDKKRKKKHPVFLEESSQKQTLDTTIENSVVEGDKVEGKESSKSKEDNKRKNKGKRVSFADSTIVFRTEGGDSDGIEGGKKKKRKAAQSKNKGKRVSFADSAEVLSIEGGDDEGGDRSDESKFVHGQRFTPEEDATLLQAIRDFIEMKQLGEKGFEMIFSCKEHKLRGCWPIIGKSLPNRPKVAIYSRARTLLSRSAERKWTKEEKDHIRQFVAKNGTDWMTLARELGKCNIHVKDTWRRIKSENLKKGHWTQDEQQKLFDLVNLDLRMKAHQNKNPDNRKLKDNISWEAISDKLTTRNHKNCCIKWYDSLASPMVKEGIWADVDDYLLVEALQKDDAVCVEDVDWDSLLDDRSGELCRRRWNQMVRALGGHRERAFIEQVDVLSKRYCPEMIEYRKPKE